MTKKILLVTAIVSAFLLSGNASAQDGLALMKIEPGARAAGMGGAFVSINGDPMSSAYNPAGAVGSPEFSASFGHNEYWENVRLETGYFSARSSEKLFLHGGIRFATISDLQSRLTPTADPEGLFDAHDVSFKGGVSYRLTDRVSAGAALGWMMEKIDAYRGSAFNFDLGVLAQATEAINLGASVSNIGSSFNLSYSGSISSRDISLPTTYRFGGSYRYEKYLGALDVVVVDDKAHAHIGAEADLHEYLSLRAGYMTGYASKDFTAGASFHITRYNLDIDYAFVPYSNDLGSSHLINLTLGI